MKYERIPEVVEAEQFSPNKPRPRGVEEQPCYCAALAQDGQRCELHKPDGRRYGIVRLALGRRAEIDKGEWVVTFTSGDCSVFSNEQFLKTFRPIGKR